MSMEKKNLDPFSKCIAKSASLAEKVTNKRRKF